MMSVTPKATPLSTELSQPISTIQHAMVLLGFNVVKTLVLSTSVLDMMSKSMAGLWQHSLACARTCAIIGRYLNLDDPEEISVTGLLHDLGKPAMDTSLWLTASFRALLRPRLRIPVTLSIKRITECREYQFSI